MSADGTSVLFGSTNSLTGDDTRLDPASPRNCYGGGNPSASEHCPEFFHYSAPSEALSCVSCNPSGARPTARALLGSTASGISIGAGGHFSFITRNLSADGNRFFFETEDALVPADTNGVSDVYEWEAKGSGCCESESQNGGCLYLISSGTSPAPSDFLDASTNGDHVFFFTDQQLVPGDRTQLIDVYDAGDRRRASPPSTSSPRRPAPRRPARQTRAPPPDPSLASSAFSGPGQRPPSRQGAQVPEGQAQGPPRGQGPLQEGPQAPQEAQPQATAANATTTAEVPSDFGKASAQPVRGCAAPLHPRPARAAGGEPAGGGGAAPAGPAWTISTAHRLADQLHRRRQQRHRASTRSSPPTSAPKPPTAARSRSPTNCRRVSASTRNLAAVGHLRST